MEGSKAGTGTGSVQINYGFGFGSRRPKNTDAEHCLKDVSVFSCVLSTGLYLVEVQRTLTLIIL